MGKIATWDDINNKYSVYDTPLDKCPTRSEIESKGLSISGDYSYNQLVDIDNINKSDRLFSSLLVNWGRKLISSYHITLSNSLTYETYIISGGGGFSNGGYRTNEYKESLLNNGSGNLSISSITLNDQYYMPSNLQINMGYTSSLSSSGSRPTSWKNNVACYYFTSGSTYLKIDLVYDS